MGAGGGCPAVIAARFPETGIPMHAFACLSPSHDLSLHPQLWYFVHQHKIVEKAAAAKAAARALSPREPGPAQQMKRQRVQADQEAGPDAGA